MNKEELEKEAKAECFMLTVNTIGIDQKDAELAYVMGAEPREKRIAELEITIGTLRLFSNEQAAQIEKLKAQIEKMKCDMLSLVKDRMNDDIDQNIIESLAEKWELKEV